MKTLQTANKDTYEKHEKRHNTEAKPPQHAATRQKTRQNNVRKRHEAAKRSTRKKHTQKHGECIKNPILACACVRVLSCKAAAPLLKSTLIFPIFTIAPPFSFPARACVVRVVVVQWWYVAMCFCVGVFCVFSPPCARWLTIQNYAARRCAAVTLCLCVCLCA